MTDIDADWDGKGSLDDHRKDKMKTLKQAGFGAGSDAAKAKQTAKAKSVAPKFVKAAPDEID